VSNPYFDLAPVIPLTGRARCTSGKTDIRIGERPKSPRIERYRRTLSRLDSQELGQHDLLFPIFIRWAKAAYLVNAALEGQAIRVDGLTRIAGEPRRKIVVDTLNLLPDMKHRISLPSQR